MYQSIYQKKKNIKIIRKLTIQKFTVNTQVLAIINPVEESVVN